MSAVGQLGAEGTALHHALARNAQRIAQTASDKMTSPQNLPNSNQAHSSTCLAKGEQAGAVNARLSGWKQPAQLIRTSPTAPPYPFLHPISPSTPRAPPRSYFC